MLSLAKGFRRNCGFKFSTTGVAVQPQNVAIPTSMIAVNPDGRPVVSFYVQFGNNTFVSSAVVMAAIQVCRSL